MTCVPERISEFLGLPTPRAWVDAARGALPELMIDHANCEKKAAATALSLIFRYPDKHSLVDRMSRLAREELRHFEQVRRLMDGRGLAWRHVSASRYAAGLRAGVSTGEPARLVDLLIVGAFIEARSCERFALLAPHLDVELANFYNGLLSSESRHFEHYLALAQEHRGPMDEADLEARIDSLRALENELISSPDEVIRFHSGPPGSQAAACSSPHSGSTRS